MSYERLAGAAERKPTKIVDHSAKWEGLRPLMDVNGSAETRVRTFCDSKRIDIESLAALGTRVVIAPSGGVALAFAYPARRDDGREYVPGLKFRPLGDGKPHAANPSHYIEPLIVGNRESLDWFVAEGETDGARLYGLVGDRAAILVLPAGALAFRREWAGRIPRGARVALCHDADEAGDAGAEKAARIIGGATMRVRPPVEGGDWCEWDGDREAFLGLIRERRPRYEFTALADFLTHPFPKAEPLLGVPGAIFLARGSLFMVYGADGAGKSTWTIDGIAHLGAGREWLGIPVPRPVRFCIVENEGPPDLFQQKLKAKIASWDGPAFTDNVFAFTGPWGEFSFANPEARAALTAFCEAHEIDCVVANPTLGLGVAASGRPDETQAFVDWLVECGLKSERAIWLLHHQNKSGAISGDWGRHPDTKVLLEKDGNQPRTKLDWDKTRWATLPTADMAKVCLLEWIVETQGYSVTEMDTVGASDSELQERIATYLHDHPASSTNAVCEGVKGTKSRIRALLDGDRFDCVAGARGAKMWLLRTTDTGSANDPPTQSHSNPYGETV